MIDVNYVAIWRGWKDVFTLWFVPASLLANLYYARQVLRLSWAKVAATDLAMTALSWVVTVGLPISLLLWTRLQAALLDKAGNGNASAWSWIVVLPITAAISAMSQIILLRRFGYTASKARFAMLALLNALSMFLAGYGTWAYIMSHPPFA